MAQSWHDKSQLIRDQSQLNIRSIREFSRKFFDWLGSIGNAECFYEDFPKTVKAVSDETSFKDNQYDQTNGCSQEGYTFAFYQTQIIRIVICIYRSAKEVALFCLGKLNCQAAQSIVPVLISFYQGFME